MMVRAHIKAVSLFLFPKIRDHRWGIFKNSPRHVIKGGGG